jgi:hypothetical protein
LTELHPLEIDGSAIIPLERQLLEALAREAEEGPSGDNVPGEGQPLRAVTKTDSATGLRTTSYYGPSFIKGMSRPGRKVLRICNPTTGDVLWGAPFSNARR